MHLICPQSSSSITIRVVLPPGARFMKDFARVRISAQFDAHRVQLCRPVIYFPRINDRRLEHRKESVLAQRKHLLIFFHS